MRDKDSKKVDLVNDVTTVMITPTVDSQQTVI